MRIGLDVRYISHGLTGGVRTYVYYLARELPRCAPDREFYFYADDKAPLELSDLPPNVVLRTLRWKGPISSIRNDAALGRIMEQDGVDIAHFPANYGPRIKRPLLVTLHDSLNLFPMSQHLRGFGTHPRKVALMLYLGRMTRASLRRATHIITVSDHARHDIAARGGYPLDRMTTIYEAGAEEFRRISDEGRLQDLRERLKLGTRVVLADGIKNPAAIVDAYGSLPAEVQRRTQLVFFSREGVPRPAVAAALDRPQVRFIGRPDTADLVGLMNIATVFAFPSFYEGFGLPLVEAMKCGTPIIGSTRGSVPEIIGCAGLVCDLERPADLTEHLHRLLTDDALRQTLSDNALARASRFTWTRMAQETLGVYDHVATNWRPS